MERLLQITLSRVESTEILPLKTSQTDLLAFSLGFLVLLWLCLLVCLEQTIVYILAHSGIMRCCGVWMPLYESLLKVWQEQCSCSVWIPLIHINPSWPGSNTISEAKTVLVHPITEPPGHASCTAQAEEPEASYWLSVHQNLTTSSSNHTRLYCKSKENTNGQDFTACVLLLAVMELLWAQAHRVREDGEAAL